MDDATRATTAEAGGGGGAPRQYKRDPKGSHTGGQFTRNPSSSTAHKPAPKARPAAPPTPSLPARGQHGKAMSRDSHNDPERVRQFQQLLTTLGFNANTSGTFDGETEAAVKQAQQKLGMKPTGHATQTLINKMLNAYDLSPCIKRSEDGSDDIERAFPDLIGDDEESGGGVVEVIERAQLSTEELNNLPDDAFAYIEPGGSKDSEGKTVPRSLRHFAIHDAAHVRNALARMDQSPFGDNARKKIVAAAKKMGIGDYDDEAHEPTGAEEPEHMTPMRSALMRCCPDEHTFAREWPLDDIVIRSGGDGRTVEAYAAVFDSPTEIKDQHGHYMETIDRAAFNEVLAEGIHRVGCFYHHGMTLHGTPSDLGSVPIGSPVDIRADGKGLRTVTRFNKSALADSVLEAIRAGDLKGYSFRGGIRKSNPPRIARARDGQPLPTVTRMSLGLNEYGPTPTPYYADAKILAVRSAQAIATDPVALAELQAELARILARSTPVLLDQEQETATPDIEGPGAEDQPQALRSAADIARRIRVAEILRGMK